MKRKEKELNANVDSNFLYRTKSTFFYYLPFYSSSSEKFHSFCMQRIRP